VVGALGLALALALPAPAQETDRLRLRLAPGDPGGAARPGTAQDLRDARRRLDQRDDVGAGYERSELRRLERRFERERRNPPAVGGRRPSPRGSRLMDTAIPHLDLDLEDLERAREKEQGGTDGD